MSQINPGHAAPFYVLKSYLNLKYTYQAGVVSVFVALHIVQYETTDPTQITTTYSQRNIGEEHVFFCPSPADVNTRCDDNVALLTLNINFKNVFSGHVHLLGIVSSI
jgi:hypothetical protein